MKAVNTALSGKLRRYLSLRATAAATAAAATTAVQLCKDLKCVLALEFGSVLVFLSSTCRHARGEADSTHIWAP
jgi:hypothetical protein